jgi:hypothetical protein
VLGYRNGTPIYDTLHTLDATGPTLITFNFIDVDLVRFISSGGVDAGYSGHATQFAVDDLRIAVTPIPAALPLFATALAGLGFIGWRRKRASA